MKFFETSKYYQLNKPTYIKLRWITIIGQLISINLVAFVFKFNFNFILSNFVILIGIFLNYYLINFNKDNYLSNKFSFFFLNMDIFQLSFLIYLTGGITNPFIVFIIIPCIFSSTNLDIKSNLLLVFTTIASIVFLTFFYKDLLGIYHYIFMLVIIIIIIIL